MKALHLHRGGTEDLTVGGQHLSLRGVNPDFLRLECFDLIEMDMVAGEDPGEALQQPGPGGVAEKGDIEEPVVDGGGGGHQEVRGEPGVGNFAEDVLAFQHLSVDLDGQTIGRERDQPCRTDCLFS